MTTHDAVQSLRESIAVAAALGRTSEVADIGMALLGLVDEAREGYRTAQTVPTTPMSGDNIGHPFGDVSLCRDCRIEVSGPSPFCGECSHERVMTALESVRS